MTCEIRMEWAQCVKWGRLLHANLIRNKQDYKVIRLAQDLARISGSREHLAKMCGLLAGLPQPSAVHSPPTERFRAWQMEESLDPRSLLEWHDDRVKALAKLALNPHTPHEAINETLTHLHPVEIACLLHNSDLPGWLRQAAAPHAPPRTLRPLRWRGTDPDR